MGPFVVTEHIGNTVCHLNLLQHAALRDVHDVFHVSLLCSWLSNGVHADVPPIKIDGKAEYKVAEIEGHQEQQGEMQYLILLVLIVQRICGCLPSSWSMHLSCSSSINSILVFVTERPLPHPLSRLSSFAICRCCIQGVYTTI